MAAENAWSSESLESFTCTFWDMISRCTLCNVCWSLTELPIHVHLARNTILQSCIAWVRFMIRVNATKIHSWQPFTSAYRNGRRSQSHISSKRPWMVWRLPMRSFSLSTCRLWPSEHEIDEMRNSYIALHLCNWQEVDFQRQAFVLALVRAISKYIHRIIGGWCVEQQDCIIECIASYVLISCNVCYTKGNPKYDHIRNSQRWSTKRIANIRVWRNVNVQRDDIFNASSLLDTTFAYS